jgi:DNA-binding IclR family transcriptional regulator
MNSTSPRRTYAVPALEKGLDILECLVHADMPLGQAELAVELNRSSNEIYRMLYCLEKRGYILREEVSGKYRLSLKLLTLARGHNPMAILREAAMEPMRRLAATVGQSCHMSLEENGQLVVALHATSPTPVALSIAEGSRFSLLQTASGNLLLAWMSAAHRDNLLAALPEFKQLSVPARKAFHDRLAQIREQAYVWKESEITRGVIDVAIPVGQPGGTFIATIAISSISSSISQSHDREEVLAACRACRDEIQAKAQI